MSREEQEQKIITLEKENQALRERIAELERRLGLYQDIFALAYQRIHLLPSPG